MVEAVERLIDDYDTGKLSRREAVTRLAAVALAIAGSGHLARSAEGNASTFKAVGLNHIALRVKELARSRNFYRDHLGLRVTDESEYNCFMQCGNDHFVALFRGNEPGLDHYCYTIPGYDPESAVKTLEAAGLGPTRRENRVYFDDPDGLTVQVSAPNS